MRLSQWQCSRGAVCSPANVTSRKPHCGNNIWNRRQKKYNKNLDILLSVFFRSMPNTLYKLVSADAGIITLIRI